MEPEKYLEDITEIKNMMSRSSRFISLSGLSGILAGVYALIGAFIAYNKLKVFGLDNYSNLIDRDPYLFNSDLIIDLMVIALLVISCAAITGIVLSIRKANKSGEKVWNTASQRLLINFFLPLLVGGIFSLVLIQNGASGLVAPTTLIFYGLACVNASKYTLGDIRYMGLSFILIGLISTQFIGLGLYFWALGFGLFHIIYGALMYFKYDRK